MFLLAEDKDIRTRPKACFKCRMIGHFVRDCMADIMDAGDDTDFPVWENADNNCSRLTCDEWSYLKSFLTKRLPRRLTK